MVLRLYFSKLSRSKYFFTILVRRKCILALFVTKPENEVFCEDGMKYVNLRVEIN